MEKSYRKLSPIALAGALLCRAGAASVGEPTPPFPPAWDGLLWAGILSRDPERRGLFATKSLGLFISRLPLFLMRLKPQRLLRTLQRVRWLTSFFGHCNPPRRDQPGDCAYWRSREDFRNSGLTLVFSDDEMKPAYFNNSGRDVWGVEALMAPSSVFACRHVMW